MTLSVAEGYTALSSTFLKIGEKVELWKAELRPFGSTFSEKVELRFTIIMAFLALRAAAG